MQAMILAAGRGSRLRPLTDSIPKPLVPLGNEPIIVYHVRRLRAAGFSSIVINLWHLGEQIEAVLGNGDQFGIRINYSYEAELLGTAGGVRQAINLNLLNAPFLLLNCDVFCDVDLELLKNTSPRAAHLVLTANPQHNPNGDFSLNNHQLLHRDAICYTYTGIGVFAPSLFSSIPLDTKHELKPLLNQAIDAQTATATVHNGYWYDLGTLERLQQAQKILSTQ